MSELEARRRVARNRVWSAIWDWNAAKPGESAGNRAVALDAALDAFAAIPAPQPPGETVGDVRRVLLYHGTGIGRETVWRATVEALPGKAGYFVDPEHWRHCATMTGRVAPPVVPVIAATVTREPGA